MARSSFSKRGSVKSRVTLHGNNAQPLGSRPGIKQSEPGQDAEASVYPANASRTKGRGNHKSLNSPGIVVSKGRGKM
jgi:hypothetical protein